MAPQFVPETTPRIDSNQVTFIWRGDDPPQLVGDFTYWGTERDPLDLEPAGEGIWSRTLEFPLDAYIEYLFDRDGIRLQDPTNDRRVQNGVGDRNNYFAMPDWRESPYIHERPDVPRGEIIEDTLDWEGLFGTPSRKIFFYRPPVAGPVPLLVVLDGPDYLQRGRIATIVDNLIAEGRIRPIAMALPENGGLARLVEYSCNDVTLGCIAMQVAPMAREYLDLVPSDGGAWGIMGASMGGLMSLYAGLRAPEMFGRVLSQSGAFDSPHMNYRFVVNDLVRLEDRPPLRIWMDAGRFEWFLPGNQYMRNLLQGKDYTFQYKEHNGGHNYTSWRNTLHRGLQYLFPPD